MGLCKHKLVVILTSLLMGVVANAGPTVPCNSIVSYFGAADTSTAITQKAIYEPSVLIEPANSELADIGRDLLKPVVSMPRVSGPRVAPGLPGVPGAFFMLVTGFVCVSLVRDRNFWLAAFATLLWMGQAGIQAVPQLAGRLSYKKHLNTSYCAKFTSVYELESYYRPRCDIEGTRYIGLLHHLGGIPQRTLTIVQSAGANIPSSYKLSAFGRGGNFSRTNQFPLPFAIIPEQYSSISTIHCLAVIARQSIYFSPAFIFDNLARGPPLENHLKFS